MPARNYEPKDLTRVTPIEIPAETETRDLAKYFIARFRLFANLFPQARPSNSYFPAQNCTFPGLRSMGYRKTKPAGVCGGLELGLRRLLDELLFHCATDVDDVVGDDAEPDQRFIPASPLCSGNDRARVAADHADASLASGPPFLSVAEPALPLLSFALGALVERSLGMQTRLTPWALAAASFLAE